MAVIVDVEVAHFAVDAAPPRRAFLMNGSAFLRGPSLNNIIVPYLGSVVHKQVRQDRLRWSRR